MCEGSMYWKAVKLYMDMTGSPTNMIKTYSSCKMSSNNINTFISPDL